MYVCMCIEEIPTQHTNSVRVEYRLHVRMYVYRGDPHQHMNSVRVEYKLHVNMYVCVQGDSHIQTPKLPHVLHRQLLFTTTWECIKAVTLQIGTGSFCSCFKPSYYIFCIMCNILQGKISITFLDKIDYL